MRGHLPGNTTYQNVIVGKGNTNSYAQLNIQNYNAGTGASSDVVATADNGSETVNYVDLGMNSSANTSTGVLGGANTAYLYSTGNDFSIGNGTTGKSLRFFTTASSSSAEAMRIDSAGRVGVGTTPTAPFHLVYSNTESGLMKLQNTNSAGYSSVDFLNSSGTLSGTFGYGNSSAASPYTGRDYFNQYGNDFIFANNPSYPLFIQGSNSYVGINTTSPGAQLDVAGNMYAEQSLWVDEAGANTGSKSPGLFFGANGTGEAIASKRTSGTDQYGLDFYTASTNRMTISNTGSVGIATNNPGSTIDVKGSVHFRSLFPVQVLLWEQAIIPILFQRVQVVQ